MSRKTAVSGVVELGGVYRDFIVIDDGDKLAPVDARTLLPLPGYSPNLPHYTQHSVYQMVKTARWTGYQGRKSTALLAATATVSPFYTARNLFEHTKELLDGSYTEAQLKEFIKRLATSFVAQS